MDFITFVLDKKISAENKENAEKLSELLKQFDIKVRFADDLLTIGSVEEDITRLKTRNAGRKQLELEKNYTVADIEKKIAATNAETVAKELKVSRSTLCRKLRSAREAGENVIN